MPTSQTQLVQVLKGEIGSLEERCSGYQARVAETLAKIVALEQQNRIRRIDIRQEVKKGCLSLGDFLAESLEHQPELADA